MPPQLTITPHDATVPPARLFPLYFNIQCQNKPCAVRWKGWQYMRPLLQYQVIEVAAATPLVGCHSG